MYTHLNRALNNIQHKIHKLIREDGILETEYAETIVYKLECIVALADSLSFNEVETVHDLSFNGYKSKLIAHLEKAKRIISVGEPDFQSQQNIIQILKNARSLVKGLDTLFELLALDEDDDIPEHIYESFEPFVDVDTGEVYEAECTELQSAILSMLHRGRVGVKSGDIDHQVSSLIGKLDQLSLELDNALVVELGDGLSGYANARAGMGAQLKNIRAATGFYFEPTHQARTQDIAQACEAIYAAKATGTTSLSAITAGEFIIAAAEALRCTLLLREDLSDYEEKLEWRNIPVSIRRKPTEKNLGNLVIRNVGRYGWKDQGKRCKKDILDDFEDIIAFCGEDRFNSILRQYGAKPFQISLDMLNLPKNTQGNKLLTKLQQNIFLIFSAEIFRYFPVEGLHACKDSKKMPYAIALGLGLELLEHGYIELHDLFDKDADFGLPTGERILDNPDRVAEKACRLLSKYQAMLKDSFQSVDNFLTLYPLGRVVQGKAEYITVLKDTFGDNLSRKAHKRL